MKIQKLIIAALTASILPTSLNAQQTFNEMMYSKEKTMFVLNAPTAGKSSVTIRLYKDGQKGKAYKTLKMKKMGDERWEATVKGDLKGKFYTFDIGKGETPGTFAKAVGVNGNRGAIVDLYDTDPVGWDKDVRPAIQSPADLVIYELHVRDFSVSPTSGLKYQGKYLALTEPKAIEYLKNLGINAIHFDGFRFDGVTSMLYYSHGLGEAFCNYGDYFNGHEDDNAICYLTLANCLIHEVNKHAITIAEEVSGMPGLAAKFEDGGYGFDYRMAMNIPDYWIKTIKELKDEDWKPSSIFWEVKNRRSDEKTISYCESHDQALVGDKTIIFRLIDADMYWHFKKGDENEMAHRGIALHKMIRLVTASTINGGYLNFMGNEFGHPEWIDFPGRGYSRAWK